MKHILLIYITLFILGCHNPPIRAPQGKPVNGIKFAHVMKLYNRETGNPTGLEVWYADGSIGEDSWNCMKIRKIPLKE